MSDNSQLELIREAAKQPSYKQVVYVNAWQLLAEIEREYLPRPRFEDGKFVQEGDTICIDGHLPLKVHSWSIRNDGITVFSCPTSHRSVKTGERVKRPAPEVLDADGIPIRVGDHVWFKQGTHYDGVEYVVTEVTKTQVHYENSEGEYPRGRCPHYCASSNLTHKQPDSLERIEEELEETFRRYFCPEDDFGPDAINGKKLQETVKDLLRRRREVLERGHER